MDKKTSRKKQAKKYFVKRNDGIFVVNDAFFDQIDSRSMALAIAVLTWDQLRDQLYDDAVSGENTFIGNMKITTGLERALAELDRRFPYLLHQIGNIERRHQGRRVYSC